MAEMTPVYLVAGPRGVGKTRLVQRTLNRPEFAGAVALADPASVALLPPSRAQAVQEGVPAFATGCACCRVSSGIVRALRALLPRARLGEISSVFVETRDPQPVLAALLTDSVVSAAFHLEKIIKVLGPEGGSLPCVSPHLAPAAQVIVVDGSAS